MKLSRVLPILCVATIIFGGALQAQRRGEGAPENTWGGDHVQLETTEDGGHFEFDCASGELSGVITPDVHGKFSVKGSYMSEHGGPTRKGESANEATYRGTIHGNSMELEILDSQGKRLEHYSLTKGRYGRVMKCK